MTDSSSARMLHVANGTCTTRLIEAAGIPGRRSIWADPLYEGPVPGGVSDEELLAIRSRYLSGDESGAADDPVNDLREWRAVIARHDDYDELVLWYEHDLFDQLNLIQLLSWIGERVPAAKPVSLVCVGSFANHPNFKGLGELKPLELASLLEQRVLHHRSVTDADGEAVVFDDRSVARTRRKCWRRYPLRRGPRGACRQAGQNRNHWDRPLAGGAYLNGGESVWRWDDEAGRVTRSRS